MLIDISQLDERGVRLDVRLDVEPFAWEVGQIVSCGPARLAGFIKPARRGMELTATMKTVATLACMRCLEPFSTAVESDFTLFVVPREHQAQGIEASNEDDPDDVDVYRLSGEKLNLAEVVREQVDLKLPLSPICSGECNGLCPGCGANRNRVACACEPAGDERWSQLRHIRSILEKDKGRGPSKGR